MINRYPILNTDLRRNKNFPASKMETLMMQKVTCKNHLSQFHKKEGTYLFVIRRNAHNPENIGLCIGRGTHYGVSGGTPAVIIAGEITFKNNKIIAINDQSGSYPVDFTGITSEERDHIYAAQLEAMRMVGFSQHVIEILERPWDPDFVPQNYNSCCHPLIRLFKFFTATKKPPLPAYSPASSLDLNDENFFKKDL